MPDCAMCQDRTCPSRALCYRYRAKPREGGRQAWATFDRDGRDRCESYIPIGLVGFSGCDPALRTMEEIDGERK